MNGLATVATARRRALPARDAQGRFVAPMVAAPRAPRSKKLPARDGRGHFVAFPTTSAPSWYVFCAGAYRIPIEDAVLAPSPIAPVAQHPLPRATVRRRGQRITHSELQTWLLVLILVVVSAWFAFHLPLPR